MKFLVSFACLLAVASAGYAPIGYTSEARLVDPVAIAAGAPLPTGDTYEVAAAKAAHLRAHAAAKGQVYTGPIASPALAYSGYPHAAPVYHGAPFASEPRQVDPVAIAAGAPLPTGDTYEVAAAKAAHFRAHSSAKGLTYGAPAVAYSGYAHAPIASEPRQVDPVAIAAGAPLPTGDTYEVAAAKAAHLQAHAAAKSGHFQAKGHYVAKRSPGYIAAPYTYPLAYTTPVRSYGYSTYAAHPIAYNAHYLAKGHFIAKRSPGYLSTAYTTPLAYHTPLHSYGYSTYASPIAYSTPYYTHY